MNSTKASPVDSILRRRHLWSPETSIAREQHERLYTTSRRHPSATRTAFADTSTRNGFSGRVARFPPGSDDSLKAMRMRALETGALADLRDAAMLGVAIEVDLTARQLRDLDKTSLSRDYRRLTCEDGRVVELSPETSDTLRRYAHGLRAHPKHHQFSFEALFVGLSHRHTGKRVSVRSVHDTAKRARDLVAS